MCKGKGGRGSRWDHRPAEFCKGLAWEVKILAMPHSAEIVSKNTAKGAIFTKVFPDWYPG